MKKTHYLLLKTIYSANADMDSVIIGLGWGGHDTYVFALRGIYGHVA